MELIKLENLSKHFNGKATLEEVNLTVSKGQGIAFIGRNGAGKSTLLKLIGKLSEPTGGKVHYSSPLTISYVPEHFPRLKLTVMQYLKLRGKIDDVSTEKIKELLQDFFMEEMTNTSLNHLSKGSLRKIGVIQALLKKPDVLLLDEPLSGQDGRLPSCFCP